MWTRAPAIGLPSRSVTLPDRIAPSAAADPANSMTMSIDRIALRTAASPSKRVVIRHRSAALGARCDAERAVVVAAPQERRDRRGGDRAEPGRERQLQPLPVAGLILDVLLGLL